ncbi:MAG: LysE family transporter [Devosia sp.]|uniref:LysE family translocator n=1 Tax=Devosia sp. TaxID=1871048 RepID=UPI001A51E2A9|nr:LysE family transporter [Devosia sp.]MBL8598265.1 LysE family transporter [Devosia sp.]
MSDPVLFFLAVLTILATPGPTNTLMATAGATRGLAGSLRLLPAEIGGYLLAIFAIHFALGQVVGDHPVIGSGLKIAVAAYLVWLAVKLWRRPLILDAGAQAVSFANVFVTTLLNPKALVFALTVLPWQSPALGWYVAAFAATVVAAGGGWIALGSTLRGAMGSRAGYLPRIAAVALLAFAGLVLRAAL